MLKKYQILSEDARCDLYFALDNISGHDNVACDGYRILIQKLTQTNSLNILLKDKSLWDNLIQMTAAAHQFHYSLNIYIDPSQEKLTLYQLYSLYVAIRMKAYFSLSPLQNMVQQIDPLLLEQSLEELADLKVASIKKQFDDLNVIPGIVVYPLETSVFDYADLYPFFKKMSQKHFTQQKLQIQPTMLKSQKNPVDLTSWVQTMDDEANLQCFYGFLNAEFQGAVSTDLIQKAFGFVPRTLLLPDYQIQNMDDLYDILFENLMNRYKNNGQKPKSTIEVSSAEVLHCFKAFINTTHTLACGAYITPFAAVMDYKFRFASNDIVVCYISGALCTTKRDHDYVTYVSDYLYDSLNENCELIDVKIYYTPSHMSTTTKIQQIFKNNGITIHHWKFNSDCASVKCYTPGYQSLVTLQWQIEELLGDKAFECPDMPRYPPTQQNLITVDYSHFKTEEVYEYKSNVASKDDITCESVKNAYHTLQQINAVDKTAVIQDIYYSKLVKSQIYLVMENIQQTGSFKIRGASNMLLKADQAARKAGKSIDGVVACSAGNHAQGVAKTAHLLGIKCTIVCPESAPETKLYNTMRYNAEVIKHGPVFDVANEFAQKLAIQRGWLFIPPYNHYDVMEGQGTIAYELLESAKDIDTILVNVGGGGMISGISLYAKKFNPNIKIVGVQASRVFPLQNYNQTGQLIQVDKNAVTIADGCNVKQPGGIHNEILQKYIDKYISVDENEIAATIINMLLITKTVTEGAGCMGLTALLYKKYQARPDEKVAIIVCGGNIDIARLQSIFKMGSVSMGKRLRVRIPLSDTPGKFLEIAKIIQRHGGIIDQVQQIDFIDSVDWDQAWLSIETRMACLKTTNALKTELKRLYPKAQFPIENLIPCE